MHVAQLFFCEETEQYTIDDEIDELFSRLEQVEPPPSLIEDILAAVAQLPPLHLLAGVERADDNDLDMLDGAMILPPHIQF